MSGVASFAQHLGIRTESAGGGEAVLALRLAPHLGGEHGGVDAGVLVSLMHAAMAQAALSRFSEPRLVTAVDLRVGFLRPSAPGQLVATARVSGGGRSLCFCEASVVGADGAVCAHAMGTLRYRTP